MYDPYLDALMHGEIIPSKKVAAIPKQEKSKFDLSIENHINKYIDSLNLEIEYGRNPLTSPAMKRAQLREELKAALKMPEFEKFLSEAFNALLTNHHHYLQPEICNQMGQEFHGIEEEIEKIDFNEPPDENYQTLFKISDAVMDGILTIAKAKYNEQEYALSLAIFTLLTSLNAGNYDYWYRLGITAQKCENYPLALKAYDIALEMSPDLIGALLFSCECHIRLDQKDAAKQRFIKAKEIASNQELDEMWKSLMSKVERAL